VDASSGLKAAEEELKGFLARIFAGLSPI